MNNIMISSIKPQFNAEYIANLLWEREIAKVSSITLIPQIENGEITNIAYINIDSFCETETAYDFVRNMSAEYFIFCHDEKSDLENGDNFWTLQKNTHNSGNVHVGPYTTKFTPDYFKYKIVEAGSDLDEIDTNYPNESESIPDDDAYICDSEEWEEFRRNRPIKGLGNDYYTIDEALAHLWVINKNLEDEHSFSQRLKLEEEFDHFENVLQSFEHTHQVGIYEKAESFGKALYSTNV